jgi:quercetin dioxygenase-like cupin family protein
VFPTLPTLLRIALVFSVGLDFFFSGSREKPVVGVVRHKDRLRFPEKPGTRDIGYLFESLDYPAVERRLNAYHVEFLPRPEQKWHLHQHPGGEFIYVLAGTLAVQIGGEEHTLEARDSVYFDSAAPHGYRRMGAKTCMAIVVTTT